MLGRRLEEIARRAAEVGAKFVLTDALRAGRVVEATAPIDSVLQVFVIGQHDGCASYDDLLQHPADGALLFYLTDTNKQGIWAPHERAYLIFK